jgi:phage host-nuclease inhibitor protein Gam
VESRWTNRIADLEKECERLRKEIADFYSTDRFNDEFD